MRGPITKYKSTPGGSNNDNLSYTLEEEAKASPTAPGKISKGKIGLEIRYCKQDELNKFSKEQMDEMVESHKWRSNNKGSGNHNNNLRFEEVKVGKFNTLSLTQSKSGRDSAKRFPRL